MIVLEALSAVHYASGGHELLVGEGPVVCRFSDAGNEEVGHTLGDRRRKSAEARNRGGVGTVGAVGSMGI